MTLDIGGQQSTPALLGSSCWCFCELLRQRKDNYALEQCQSKNKLGALYPNVSTYICSLVNLNISTHFAPHLLYPSATMPLMVGIMAWANRQASHFQHQQKMSGVVFYIVVTLGIEHLNNLYSIWIFVFDA